MKKDLIVTLADKNYIDQAKQLFSSIYWNSGWKGDYMLLVHGDVPKKDLDWFKKKGILIKLCKPLFHESEIKGRPFNKRKWFIILTTKFYLFTPYFKKWKNIVYLDTDIIVKAPLDDLTKINGFAAVRAFPLFKFQFLKNRKKNLLFEERKKIYNLITKTFNAGFFVFNTNLITQETFNKLKELFKKYNSIIFNGDEEIFNLFFYKKWKKLPLVYNFNPYLVSSPLLLKKSIKAIILHFVGEGKPWCSQKNYYGKEWNYNLRRAELIDLNKPRIIKKWTDEYIKKISKNLILKIFIYLPLNKLEKLIGLFGKFLKKNFPRLYYELK